MEEGQNVLCTVEKIEGTTVFVKIEDNQEGTIVTSEIAPGRIRNIRDYVVPGKKIVCKILFIEGNNIHLSLRRVSEKERKEVLDRFEQEKSSISILKTVVKENIEDLITKIKEKEKSSIYDFLQNCKINPTKLDKYLKKEDSSRICKILQERKEKLIEVKKELSLSNKSKSGMTIIKKILMPYKDKLTYLAAGRFMVKIKAENYKSANQEIQKILEDIENHAEKNDCDFQVKEK